MVGGNLRKLPFRARSNTSAFKCAVKASCKETSKGGSVRVRRTDPVCRAASGFVSFYCKYHANRLSNKSTLTGAKLLSARLGFIEPLIAF